MESLQLSLPVSGDNDSIPSLISFNSGRQKTDTLKSKR